MATEKAASEWQRVAVLRHGQSVNVVRWLQRKEGAAVDMVPDTEDHLTDLGQVQARLSAEALVKILKRPPHNTRTKVDLISSPSTRCRDTAKVVAQVLQEAGWSQGSTTFSNELLELKAYDYNASEAGSNQLDDWNRVVFSPNIEPASVRVIVTHGNILRQSLAYKWAWPKHLSLAPTVTSLTIMDYNRQGQTVLHNLCDSGVLGEQARQWFNEDVFS